MVSAYGIPSPASPSASRGVFSAGQWVCPIAPSFIHNSVCYLGKKINGTTTETDRSHRWVTASLHTSSIHANGTHDSQIGELSKPSCVHFLLTFDFELLHSVCQPSVAWDDYVSAHYPCFRMLIIRVSVCREEVKEAWWRQVVLEHALR